MRMNLRMTYVLIFRENERKVERGKWKEENYFPLTQRVILLPTTPAFLGL